MHFEPDSELQEQYEPAHQLQQLSPWVTHERSQSLGRELEGYTRPEPVECSSENHWDKRNRYYPTATVWRLLSLKCPSLFQADIPCFT